VVFPTFKKRPKTFRAKLFESDHSPVSNPLVNLIGAISPEKDRDFYMDTQINDQTNSNLAEFPTNVPFADGWRQANFDDFGRSMLMQWGEVLFQITELCEFFELASKTLSAADQERLREMIGFSKSAFEKMTSVAAALRKSNEYDDAFDSLVAQQVVFDPLNCT